MPLQNPEQAARELERAVKELGFVGALVNGYSNIGDENTAQYLDEPQVHVFWSKVEQLGVPFICTRAFRCRASSAFIRAMKTCSARLGVSVLKRRCTRYV